jgi:hypothetical protein
MTVMNADEAIEKALTVYSHKVAHRIASGKKRESVLEKGSSTMLVRKDHVEALGSVPLVTRIYETLVEWRYIIWVVIFYIAHIYIWRAFHPSWTYAQCFYFITATITTVGYGDLSANDNSGRLYSIFFLILGLATVTSVISGWVDRMLEALEAYMLTPKDENDDAAKDEGEDKGKENVVVTNSAYRYRKILFSMAVIFVMIIAGTLYMCIHEGWTFEEGVYWSVVTALTVGYGDMSFDHEHHTLILVSVYMMVSTMCVAVALGNFVEVTIEIEQERKKNDLLLNVDILELLVSQADTYDDHHHESGSNTPRKDVRMSKEALVESIKTSKVSKCDFMLFMLEKLHGVDRKTEIDPLLKKFCQLDKDESDTLDISDVLEYEAQVNAEKEAHKTYAQNQTLHKRLYNALFGGDGDKQQQRSVSTATVMPTDDSDA